MDSLRELVFAHAADRYGVRPEYLWADSPDAAVLRRADNRRWFGLVMSVRRARLGLPGAGFVCVLDVKCDPLLLGSLRREPGFLPAYHMNKASWLTVLLDGSVPAEQVFDLLALSWELTAPAAKKTRRTARP